MVTPPFAPSPNCNIISGHQKVCASFLSANAISKKNADKSYMVLKVEFQGHFKFDLQLVLQR